MFNFLFGKKQEPTPQYSPFDLQKPIVWFSEKDAWTIADACEGTQIFGGTGSGKTSGSGKTIAKSFLAAGFGGLVLTAKPDEKQTWIRYCEEMGCSQQLLIMSPQNGFKFNFLNYELMRPGVGAGMTENLVGLFYSVLEIVEQKSGGGSDPYWERATKQLLRNTIDLIIIARGTLSVMDMYEVINSAPLSHEYVRDVNWQTSSFCFKLIKEAESISKTRSRELDLTITIKYETNIFPELTHQGAIILIDLPIKEYNEIGLFAQIIFKYIWQQATERRNVHENPRPVFLWADESQYFITSYDQTFQTTARSSRACTVYLTQNLPNYITTLSGGREARAKVDAFLGNLQTKIFHANGDSVTNNWASELIAKKWQYRSSINTSTSQDGSFFFPEITGKQKGINKSESLDLQVLPYDFTTLKKGGNYNDLMVEAIIVQGGRVWNTTKKNYLRTAFHQAI